MNPEPLKGIDREYEFCGVSNWLINLAKLKKEKAFEDVMIK